MSNTVRLALTGNNEPTEASVRAAVVVLLREKAHLTKEQGAILTKKLDGVIAALIRGQVLNAAAAADDACSFVLSLS